METDAIVTASEKAFKRFLYIGQKSPKYIAGCNKLNNIEELTFFNDVVKDITSGCQTVKALKEAKVLIIVLNRKCSLFNKSNVVFRKTAHSLNISYMHWPLLFGRYPKKTKITIFENLSTKLCLIY